MANDNCGMMKVLDQCLLISCFMFYTVYTKKKSACSSIACAVIMAGCGLSQSASDELVSERRTDGGATSNAPHAGTPDQEPGIPGIETRDDGVSSNSADIESQGDPGGVRDAGCESDGGCQNESDSDANDVLGTAMTCKCQNVSTGISRFIVTGAAEVLNISPELLTCEQLSVLEDLWFSQARRYANRSALDGVRCLANLRSIDISMLNVDVSPLYELRSLRQLNHESAGVTDSSIYTPLVGLERLNVSGNEITSIDPIRVLKKLREFYLDRYTDIVGGQLSDISAISDLVNIELISLVGQSVVDLSALAKCNKLRYLNIKATRAEKLPGTWQCPNLETLDLSETIISDLRPLVQCTRLKYFKQAGLDPIMGTPGQKPVRVITDLDFVGWISSLRDVDVSSQAISDLGSLRVIQNLLDLKIDVRGNPIDCEQQRDNINILKDAGLELLSSCYEIESAGQ